MNTEKLKDSLWLKIIDGKPVMADVPTFKQWCKFNNLPQDRIARSIYDDCKEDIPTLLRIVQAIFDSDLERARKMLNEIADQRKIDYEEY